MRRLALATVFLLACPIALAQMHCRAMAGPGGISPCAQELAAAVSQEGFQKVEWPAVMDKLKNSPALPYFKQGMTQYYGLNYEEAIRNFKKAKDLDKTIAMASWGIALAAGPNINLDMTDACHALAKTEINCANSLAGGKPQEKGCEQGGSITQLEKDLIGALKKRYDYDVPEEAKKHAEAYRDAMAQISTDHPDDKNVSTLYAESMMDLHPWDLYGKDGVAKKWTGKIVKAVEKATGTSLESIGGNHYYIHAIEGSAALRKKKSTQTAAMGSANLLQTQVPASGHLVHMSSHIYLLRGKYQESLAANIKGANNDITQYGEACRGPYTQYTTNPECPQLYYGHYLSHNYLFGSVSATFMGQSKNAIALACDTQAHVQRFVAYEPGLQRYLSAPFMTLVVNRNWDALCDETCQNETAPPKPTFENCYSQGTDDSGCHVLRSIWYWARGMARVAQGKDANAYLDAMIHEIKEIPKCSEDNRTSHNTFGNNCARDVLNIGKSILEARIVWAHPDKTFDDPECPDDMDRPDKDLRNLRCAVTLENKLVYDEPPQWFTPAREALGGAYLQNRMYEEAIRVFKADLALHPASGRALYGLLRGLNEHITELQFDKEYKEAKALDREKSKVRDEFCDAWNGADYTMTDADLWPPSTTDPRDGHDSTCSSERKISKPAPCTCPATIWPPPANAVDIPANEDAFLKCK